MNDHTCSSPTCDRPATHKVADDQHGHAEVCAQHVADEIRAYSRVGDPADLTITRL